MMVADDDDAERKNAAWLAGRKRGVGSSEIAAVCGLSKWSTPFRLWMEKVGLREPQPDNESLLWGRRLEPVVALAYEEEVVGGGAVLTPVQKTFAHPEFPFVLASPDRFVGTRKVLECKTAELADAKEWGPPGTDQFPVAYHLQVQWQLLVLAHLGYESADLAVLIGRSDFRVYPDIRPQPEMQAEMLRRAREFWALVEARTPPPLPWDDPEIGKLVDRLNPPTQPDAEAELSIGELAEVAEYERLGHRIDDLEHERDVLRARITLAMGPCGIAPLPDGRRLTRKTIVVPEKHVPARTQPRREYVRLSFAKGQQSGKERSQTDGHIDE
jgi:putative phage-type endonuclease